MAATHIVNSGNCASRSPYNGDLRQLTKLTSRQETGSSAHSDRWGKHHTLVRTGALICTASKCFTLVFENNTVTCFVYITVVLGQSASLSKEACLYADADWLGSSVSQRAWKGKFNCPNCVHHLLPVGYPVMHMQNVTKIIPHVTTVNRSPVHKMTYLVYLCFQWRFLVQNNFR